MRVLVCLTREVCVLEVGKKVRRLVLNTSFLTEKIASFVGGSAFRHGVVSIVSIRKLGQGRAQGFVHSF